MKKLWKMYNVITEFKPYITIVTSSDVLIVSWMKMREGILLLFIKII
jgi:hypothetical protein